MPLTLPGAAGQRCAGRRVTSGPLGPAAEGHQGVPVVRLVGVVQCRAVAALKAALLAAVKDHPALLAALVQAHRDHHTVAGAGAVAGLGVHLDGQGGSGCVIICQSSRFQEGFEKDHIPATSQTLEVALGARPQNISAEETESIGLLSLTVRVQEAALSAEPTHNCCHVECAEATLAAARMMIEDLMLSKGVSVPKYKK